MRGRSEEHGPSSLVIKPPGEAHANRYGPAGARCLIVEVTPERLSSLDDRQCLFEAPKFFDQGLLVALASRMYGELRAVDGASSLILEGLALEFLGVLTRKEQPTIRQMPRWLREAREEIHASFASPLGLSDLAASAGVDVSHFARTFRAKFGSSVGAYVRQLRLRYAAEQLASTSLTLAEIAHGAGFYDQSHLTNAFRTCFGMTPSAYRKAMAEIAGS
jgi:AraC family transcriptional regulator